MKSRIYDASAIQAIARYVGLDQLMDDVIKALTSACREFDTRSMVVPQRAGFEYSEPHAGLVEWMPAMRSGADVVIKIVGYHPSNPTTRNLPTILSTALAFDTETGRLQTIMDGTFLTALRTGAASAVASRVLADPASKTLGLIGAGAQAISQVHALSRIFDLDRVVFYDTDPNCANSFPDRAATLGLDNVEYAAESVENLVRSADIICTATSVEIGEGPVFPDIGLKHSVHINAVGADFSGKVEVPHSLLQRSLVCPDSLEQALREGECQQLRPDQIGPELADLIKNDEMFSAQHGNSTLFDSTGWALEDYITVGILAGYGQKLGVGRDIELTRLLADPRNPYAFIEDGDGHREKVEPAAGNIYTLNET
jgi:ornithine cyclodeaminase/alanine dehydrogenase-like protein (mu-crystallin family)